LLDFFTGLALWKPRSTQPAAYGHLQTLADLIDDWEMDKLGRFWWGDRSGSEDGSGVRHAGMSARKEELGRVEMDHWYAGSAASGSEAVKQTS
jgi:hypothetical protein